MADEPAAPAVVEPPPATTPEVRPELQNLLDKKMTSRKQYVERKPSAPEPSPTPTPPPAAQPTPEPATDVPSLPSFLRESLEPPAPKPEPVQAPAELPEDFAASEKDPKKQADLKNLRTEYNTRGRLISTLKEELSQAKAAGEKPSAETEATLKRLQDENTRLLGIAERAGLENHPQFQAIVRNRNNAIGYAAKTLKELGVDPTGLNKVLSSTGKDRYEALDDLTRDLPQSARDELSNVFRAIRGWDEQIAGARANVKPTLEALQKQDLEASQKALETEKENWRKTFDSLWATMRDKSGVEVFRKSDDPKDTEWNARVDAMQENARRIILDNPDPTRLIAAVQLGHAADAYRSLFYSTRDALIAANKKLAGYERATPTITPDIGVDHETEPQIKPGDRSKTLGRLGVEYLEKNRNRA
jgi:hypothetical protein